MLGCLEGLPPAIEALLRAASRDAPVEGGPGGCRLLLGALPGLLQLCRTCVQDSAELVPPGGQARQGRYNFYS